MGCHTCWFNYFTLVCLWCGQPVGWVGGRCTVTWLPNFLGWVVYHIFYPWCFAARASRARAPLKSGSRSFSVCNDLIFFSTILGSEALVYNSYFILFYSFIYFFRTAVLWKLFDTRFSYKHCNFPTPVCLPIMQDGVETVTRSITACKPLTWKLCHVGPLLRVEFLMSSEHRPILAYKSTD